MKHSKVSKYIPLNAGETAVLQDANTILPRDEIYEPLVELIKQARNRAACETNEAKSKPLSNQRVHNAISIDGARGTGKTAVLVNLKRYIELEHKELLTDIHILEPIDPTLLEDGESLFLHIIVAAVLHDDDIKQAQHCKPEQSRALNQALDKLAHSLEAVDTQKERHGMDKVRAMYGNKHLADSVHNFFLTAARLLDKKLLVLPIDDVDTSLNLAFENLEIIRRYLTTPYILPIVSGDRALYHEVTWRDFHGRLIKDSTYRRQEAYITAVDLAEEYQRKVLPFPRRQIMPEVSSYWQWGYDRKDAEDKGVMLGNTSDGMPLTNFISWLEIYLTGPVNGQENSRLPLPIPSIRALTQLVNHCSDFIPVLPDAIRTANNELDVRRMWQMPTVPLAVINTFQAEYHALGKKEEKRDYGDAYKGFSENLQSAPAVDYLECKSQKKSQQDFSKKLADYFRFEPKAGAIYLVLLAKLHWQHRTSSDPSSIFDTPLFQPLEHNVGSLNFFDKSDDLAAWANSLADRLPEEWLRGLRSQQTILPYPVAEIGINSSKRWNYASELSSLQLEDLNNERKHKATFLINLLAQNNFYTNAKQSMLLNIGRIFELIIASITGPVSLEDLYGILNRAPFFSTAALAPTKTLQLEDEDARDTTEEQRPTNVKTEEDPQHALIIQLQDDIKKWRDTHSLELINLSPWLVYKVFNKVYSQVASSEIVSNGMKHIGTVVNRVAHTFYATWFAFGSFEKGELFGLPNVITTTNINPENLKNFENNDNFNVNVRPFALNHSEITNKQSESYQNRSKFGKNTRTVSYCLADHPLKIWIDEIIELKWPSLRAAKTALFKEFGLPETTRISWTKIDNLLIKQSADEVKDTLKRFENEFGADDSVVKELKKRVSRLFKAQIN
ncbi:antiviral RADAR system adenosine triphosphatase RdrA [Aeromonas veronii]|nr:antiviral RADAR system adenosine triphosphatase RdrA [Aeromonas veronii]